MKKHFVTFYSPGTFVSESTTREIESWDVDTAIEMSKKIIERHGAKPYGFQFTTRERLTDDLDSKEVSRSNLYYLGGRIMTLAEVKAEMPEERILISNMERNGYGKIIVNDNSYRFTRFLDDDDVVLEYEAA